MKRSCQYVCEECLILYDHEVECRCGMGTVQTERCETCDGRGHLMIDEPCEDCIEGRVPVETP